MSRRTFFLRLTLDDPVDTDGTTSGLPHRFTQHKHEVSGVTGVWLQPSVSTIVASASGAIVAEYLPPGHAKLTVVISYILLGTGFLPALLIMGMYFHRLAIHKVSPGRHQAGPPYHGGREEIETDDLVHFIDVSPADPLERVDRIYLPPPRSLWARRVRHPPSELGHPYPVYAIRGDLVVLGGRDQVVRERHLRLFHPVSRVESREFAPKADPPLTLSATPVISIALVVWGFGLVWLVLATSSVLNLMRREKVGFNMGWWGFTFPIGVFAVCTTQFGTELDSMAFKVLGTILSCTVVLLWMYVGTMTLIRAWTGVM